MQQISVTTLVNYLKDKLDTDNNIQHIIVSGEISNFKRAFTGHAYFTLKDEQSAISCVMFKTYADSLSFEPKAGDKVLISANTSLYKASGTLQLYVLKITLDGLGDLYAKYEALKNKLEINGIFDNEHKKILDKKYINSVAVLVGNNSAAMSDIKTTFNRRWPICEVDFYPVLVQGEEAPKNIIDNLKLIDLKGYDAIILARGGGSFEDLFCFNDENLVMCIYNLRTFIITGVGHEQDFTLVDFVADCRAATPTAAVEQITPNIIDIKNDIDLYKQDLDNLISIKLDNNKMNFDYYFEKLSNYQNRLNIVSTSIDNSINQIKLNLKISIENRKLTLKRYLTLIDAYSYENTLKRGYTIVLQNGKVVKNKKTLEDKEFTIKFIDGDVLAKKR